MAWLSFIFSYFYHVSIVWEIDNSLTFWCTASKSFGVLFWGARVPLVVRRPLLVDPWIFSRWRILTRKTSNDMNGGLEHSSSQPLGKGEEAEIKVITSCQWFNLKSHPSNEASQKPLRNAVQRASCLVNIHPHFRRLVQPNSLRTQAVALGALHASMSLFNMAFCF